MALTFNSFDAVFLRFSHLQYGRFVINDDTGGLVIFNSRGCVLIKINRIESCGVAARFPASSAFPGPFLRRGCHHCRDIFQSSGA